MYPQGLLRPCSIGKNFARQRAFQQIEVQQRGFAIHLHFVTAPR